MTKVLSEKFADAALALRDDCEMVHALADHYIGNKLLINTIELTDKKTLMLFQDGSAIERTETDYAYNMITITESQGISYLSTLSDEETKVISEACGYGRS
jgi:hypothetical protein